MLPTRLWQLAAGVLVAIAKRHTRFFLPASLQFLLEVAAGVLICAGVAFSVNGVTKWSLIVTAATALFLLCGSGPVSKLLSLRPMVFIGKISYSLYLWHWPIWVAGYYTSMGNVSFPLSLLMTAICFLLAYFSWKYVEVPFRSSQVNWHRITRQVLPLGIFTLIFPFCGILTANSTIVQTPIASLSFPDPRTVQQIDKDQIEFLGETTGEMRFLVIGDSHGIVLSRMFARLAKENNLYGGIIVDKQMLPLRDRNNADTDIYNKKIESIYKYIERHNIQNIVFVNRWSMYFKNRKNSEQNFIYTMSSLLEQGKQVFIVEEVPLQPYECPLMATEQGIYTFPITEEHAQTRKKMRALVAGLNSNKVHLVETQDLFEKQGEFVLVEKNKLLYSDENHVNAFGAEYVKPRLQEIFTILSFKGE